MTDFTAPARAAEEEARTARAVASYNLWLNAAKAIAPRHERLREIRAAILDVDARQRAAEAPYVADDIEIEREIQRLRAKQSALYEERQRIAAPFESELDALYEQENEING